MGIKDNIKRFAERLNKYANLIVAFATLLLVLVTAYYICEAQQMRIETKKLVDLNVRQFKVLSYPSIFIQAKQLSFESNKLSGEFSICNRGEITAFEVSALPVIAYKSTYSKKLTFLADLRAFYESDRKKTSVDYVFNITKEACAKLTQEFKLLSKEEVKKPVYALIFVRFKVPYDESYTYETHSYVLEEDKFEFMHRSDTEDMAARYLRVMRQGKGSEEGRVKILAFFEDYPS